MFGIREIAEEIRSLKNAIHEHRLANSKHLTRIELEVKELREELMRSNGDFVAADTNGFERVSRIPQELGEEIEDMVRDEFDLPDRFNVAAITPEQVYIFEKEEETPDER